MDTAEALSREILEVIPFAMRVIREEMRRHRGSDLTIPQFRSLLFLQRNPGVSLRLVADHLGLTPPTVSKMIQGLVSRKLVERPDSASDRRRVELRLSVRGSALVDRVREETAVRFAERLGSLPPADREKLLSALDSLRRALQSGEKAPAGKTKPS